MTVPQQAHTADFKELDVKRVKAGQCIKVAAIKFCLTGQTLRNWAQAADTFSSKLRTRQIGEHP